MQSTPSAEWMESVLQDLRDATSAIDCNTLEDTENQENSKDLTANTAAFLVRGKYLTYVNTFLQRVGKLLNSFLLTLSNLFIDATQNII